MDFYCAEKRLIVEIDGEIHDNQEHRKYDELRDKYFRELDYKVLRFTNKQVDQDVGEVVKEIENNLKTPSSEASLDKCSRLPSP